MSRRLLIWLLVLAAWTLLAIVFAVSSSLTYVLTYRPPQWGRTFGLAASEWYPWAALTPVVAALATRLTLARHRRAIRALTLAAAGLPIAMVKVMSTRVLREVAGSVDYFQISNITTPTPTERARSCGSRSRGKPMRRRPAHDTAHAGRG